MGNAPFAPERLRLCINPRARAAGLAQPRRSVWGNTPDEAWSLTDVRDSGNEPRAGVVS